MASLFLIKRRNNMDLGRVRIAIKKMEDTMTKYSEYGASDSEPDGVWQSLLIRAMEGEKVVPPKSGDDWQLFTNSDLDCREAAKELYLKSSVAVVMISAMPIGELEPLRSFLRDYCWRYTF
jgi:hypothetical protein